MMMFRISIITGKNNKEKSKNILIFDSKYNIIPFTDTLLID